MHRGWLPAALASAVLLVGCAEQTTSPAGTTSSARPPSTGAAAPAAAGPAGTRFDGRYTGPAIQTMSRNNQCGPQQIAQALMVEQGQARYVVDRPRNIIATGQVQADGSVHLTSDSGGNNTVTGRIEDGVFTGDYRSTACGRSLSLRRQG